MTGWVDSAGRALLSVRLLPPHSVDGVEIAVWIDTGFTGDLTLPQSLIDSLELESTGAVGAVLADGSTTRLETFACGLEWFGDIVALEVIANSGQFPLLGSGLLLDRKLLVDYPAAVLELD
jgi:predicted aspartyl protease